MQSQVACAYGVQDLKKRKSPQKRGAKAWRNMLVTGKMHSGEERALKNRKSRLQSDLGSQWDEKSELFAQTWLASLTQKPLSTPRTTPSGPSASPEVREDMAALAFRALCLSLCESLVLGRGHPK